MRYKRCNRKIKSKLSKERGYGSTYWNKVQLEQKIQVTKSSDLKSSCNNNSILVQMITWISNNSKSILVSSYCSRIITLLKKVHIKQYWNQLIRNVGYLTRKILPRYAKEFRQVMTSAVIPLLKIEHPTVNKQVIIIKT